MKKEEKKNKEEIKNTRGMIIAKIVIFVLIAGVFVFYSKVYLGFENVQGDSMNPTLHNNQQLIGVNAHTTGVAEDDIVTFINPQETSEMLIKRVNKSFKGGQDVLVCTNLTNGDVKYETGELYSLSDYDKGDFSCIANHLERDGVTYYSLLGDNKFPLTNSMDSRSELVGLVADNYLLDNIIITNSFASVTIRLVLFAGIGLFAYYVANSVVDATVLRVRKQSDNF